MACNSCSKPFSLLRKEKGCPGCGFSYCSKCLNNKIFVPKLNAEGKVCAKCNNAVNTNGSKKVVEAPDAYYRRIGAMNETNIINKTEYNNSNKEDQLIYERLQKLKENKNKQTPTLTDDDIRNRLSNIKGEMPSTSNAEIEARLAKLRGVPIETIASKPGLPPPDTRTEQEQVDDLLKQYMDKSSIDSKYKDEFDNLIHELESRVQKLKGTSNPLSSVPSEKTSEIIESDDEEETVKKIVDKVKAEASIDDDNTFPSTNDELPFCEICNEDAKMRCLGCKYLFCKRCFNEHKDDDDDCNRYEPYQAPRNFSN